MTPLYFDVFAWAMMAWRPLLEPIDITAYRLWLMLPLAFAVATVYKAIKIPDVSQLPRQATILFLQIVAFMFLALLGLWLLTELV